MHDALMRKREGEEARVGAAPEETVAGGAPGCDAGEGRESAGGGG
jgi:hypothetical protein